MVSTKRTKSLCSPQMEPTLKNERPTKVFPEKAARLDNGGHLPVLEDVGRMFKKEGCDGKTDGKCLKCDVNLCLNKRSNCFVDFHTQ